MSIGLNLAAGFIRLLDNKAMSESMRDRIGKRLAAVGKSSYKASTAAGFERSYLYEFLKGDKDSLQAERLPAVAKALETTVSYLIGESDDPSAEPAPREPNPPLEPSSAIPMASKLVPYLVAGTAQAGTFREVWEFDQSEPEYIYAEPDTDFPQARRFACKVAGDSMNELKPHPIVEGSTAFGVAYGDISHLYPLRPGLIVVVQRERDGGHIREWSVKQIEIRGEEIWFCPRSTNTRHKAFSIPMVYEPEDGDRVEVLALVRGVMNKFSL